MSSTKDWYREYLASQHWIEMRRKAHDKYGRACSIIGCKSKRIHVHHISYSFIGSDQELNDLRPVCWLHHWLCHHKLFKPWKRIPLNRKHLTKRYMEVKRMTWRYFRPSDWLKL